MMTTHHAYLVYGKAIVKHPLRVAQFEAVELKWGAVLKDPKLNKKLNELAATYSYQIQPEPHHPVMVNPNFLLLLVDSTAQVSTKIPGLSDREGDPFFYFIKDLVTLLVKENYDVFFSPDTLEVFKENYRTDFTLYESRLEHQRSSST